MKNFIENRPYFSSVIAFSIIPLAIFLQELDPYQSVLILVLWLLIFFAVGVYLRLEIDPIDEWPLIVRSEQEVRRVHIIRRRMIWFSVVLLPILIFSFAQMVADSASSTANRQASATVLLSVGSAISFLGGALLSCGLTHISKLKP